eukprot:3365852-Alexandrium_andersonii.AAC.1
MALCWLRMPLRATRRRLRSQAVGHGARGTAKTCEREQASTLAQWQASKQTRKDWQAIASIRAT